MSKSICKSMGRFSSTWRTFAAASLALALITLIAGTQLPAMAAWHPPGPTQAAPLKRAVVRSATVPFRWHKAKNARGYDLRVARDRRFRASMQTLHVRALKARLAARARALVLEGARDGQAQLALVEHRADHGRARAATSIRPRGRAPCA